MSVRTLVATVVVLLSLLPSVTPAQDRPSDGGVLRLNNGRWTPVEGFGNRVTFAR